MTLIEKTKAISLAIDSSKKLVLGKCNPNRFVRYNNTDSFLEENKEKIGIAVHLEWHVANNKNHKVSDKSVTCCFHIEEYVSQINWERIVYSDLFKKFEELVFYDIELFDKDLILIKETPDTFDCRNLMHHGKNIRSYWIGFEFSKIEDFDNRKDDIVLYSYIFGNIINKHIWLIKGLI
tara:strand:+ start:187 stop:723 length:537 start_codon:yes stop_codon:yes gene_type:complete